MFPDLGVMKHLECMPFTNASRAGSRPHAGWEAREICSYLEHLALAQLARNKSSQNRVAPRRSSLSSRQILAHVSALTLSRDTLPACGVGTWGAAVCGGANPWSLCVASQVCLHSRNTKGRLLPWACTANIASTEATSKCYMALGGRLAARPALHRGFN